MLVITNEDRQKRQAELDRPEIDRLKTMGEMGRIIAQAKHGIDADYSQADAGEPPQGAVC